LAKTGSAAKSASPVTKVGTLSHQGVIDVEMSSARPRIVTAYLLGRFLFNFVPSCGTHHVMLEVLSKIHLVASPVSPCSRWHMLGTPTDFCTHRHALRREICYLWLAYLAIIHPCNSSRVTLTAQRYVCNLERRVKVFLNYPRTIQSHADDLLSRTEDLVTSNKLRISQNTMFKLSLDVYPCSLL
jgi:hypothetical protein